MKLNEDIYAGDILRAERRFQIDQIKQLSSKIQDLEGHLERLKADRQTATERADAVTETLTKLVAPE